MEDLQAKTVSEDTTETIQEKTNNSEVPVDQEQTTPQPGDPSAASHCESTSTTQSEHQLRLFTTLLMVRLLTKCHTVPHGEQEEWIAHTQRLINQTLERLTETEPDGIFPHTKSTKKVYKAVMRDLIKMFGGRDVLESAMLLQDPVIDSAIVQTVQTHIRKFLARLAKKETSKSTLWQDVLQVMASTVGVLGAIVLMILIP